MNSDMASCCGSFAEQYELAAHPAFRALESAVLGCDYGGTSWTTRAQATQLGQDLQLSAGTRWLELGSGSGWPGLYLAHQFGCQVTLLDMPLNALSQARQRARQDGLQGRVRFLSANAEQIPLTASLFDAISHSDVLCCLPGKQDMLSECRRVTAEGGLMAFFVIDVASGLDADQRAMVIENGPPFIDADQSYAGLLEASGWALRQQRSVNQKYEQTLQAMVDGLEDGRSALLPVMGEQAWTEEVDRRRQQRQLVASGLMVREYYVVKAV